MMEALIGWTKMFGTKLFKNKYINEGEVIGKPNEMLCAEQLSRRVKEDLGLDNENNDTSDYTKYL
ncbi:hypothetical protein QF117_17905 [Vibrio sp. YMD68]|uniref:hypothetical protein n=1 Tax=Vibrio sp. YMD68 TaxID=3042300 RepID=UPI00249BCCED|nr:hypothetical protein [Vibrio sp. YMD68]WGV99776.1 hypothetical protein QF117_17905 [Vibrio sp. YMD68]